MKPVRQAITPETAATLTTIMEDVVLRGTGRQAQLDRLSGGGQDRHGGQARRPAVLEDGLQRVVRRLRAVAASGLHDPGRHRHAESRPHVRRRRRRADFQADRGGRAARNGVPPTINPTPPIFTNSAATTLASLNAVTPPPLPTLTMLGGQPVMPDLRGLSARDATRVLGALGMTARLNGDGFVAAQSPEPGAAVGAGQVEPARSAPTSRRSHRGRPPAMTLGALVAAARTLAPDAARRRRGVGPAGRSRVVGVAHDSRAVAPAPSSSRFAGSAPTARRSRRRRSRRGAVAVVAETPAPDGTKRALASHGGRAPRARGLAHPFLRPSQRALTSVGVTGTNGKTTTTYLLASVFDAAGLPCGRIGTVTVRIGPSAADERDASHTTPEAPEVQRLLREMVDGGCRACAMEVSSHALALQRVADMRFAAGDLHEPDARPPRLPRRHGAVLRRQAPAVRDAAAPARRDRQRGRSARRRAGAIARPRASRTRSTSPRTCAPTDIHSSLDGLAFDAETPRGALAMRSPLVGRPNVYNMLGVVAAAVALDLPTDGDRRRHRAARARAGALSDGLGRADDVRVVVDYAHTDDALKNLLETARPLAPGRADHRVRLRRRSRSHASAR